VPGSAQQGIDFVPKHPDQIISIQFAVGFHVANDRFYRTAPFKFFAWWKRHLKVYYLIARSKHG
jgi:hypothetical protein